MRPLGQHESKAAQIIDSVLAVEGDMIHLLEAEASGSEAIIDGFGGQTGPMFDPAEAFFFCGRDEFSVAHEASGRISVICVNAENVCHLR